MACKGGEGKVPFREVEQGMGIGRPAVAGTTAQHLPVAGNFQITA